MAEFEFVDCSEPDQNGPPRRRTVRSHAARNPVARRDRVLQYQREREERARKEAEEAEEAAEQEMEQTLERQLFGDVYVIERGPWSAPCAPKMALANCSLHRHPAPLDVLTSARSDPFGCLGTGLRSVDYFLLDHFNCMVWAGIGTYVLCTPEEREYWCGRIRRHWVQMASEDPGVMAAISAACCRHLDMVSGTNAYRHLALEHYARIVASVREDLSDENAQPKDTTIIKTISLATEAIAEDDSETAMRHVSAAVRMYQLQDGAATKDPAPLTCHEDSEFGYKDRFEDRKAMISLFGSRSPFMRRKALKWRRPNLEEGCFLYVHFMFASLQLA
ncbi:hypothetical protein CC79DRAFT_1363086 [Sarocladium strictum]